MGASRLSIYNTLSRKIERFKPSKPPKVMMYTCGPTVYDFAHLGNFRTYTLSDLLVRVLTWLGYEVTHVMNITDVGHLTSDADTGEDKLEKGARREGTTAWDIARKYTDLFLKDMKALNLRRPDVMPKATDHIKEQIELIKKLEKRGLTYRTSDGIYFDTRRYKYYGLLSNLKEKKPGTRIEENPEKRDQSDFALWKFSPKDRKRDMEWDSPWGTGFPGWHIECSAMSMKYLGEQLDLHVGGEDLLSTHHPNEIAQSEAATGKRPFVRYWVHGIFMLVEGEKMSKSKGNLYTLADLTKRGFDPLALRYLYLTTHYRSHLNFTWEGLEAAQKALNRLQATVLGWERPQDSCPEHEESFTKALGNDLDLPRALTILWDVVKSDHPSGAKHQTVLKFDQVLGLGLAAVQAPQIPERVEKLVAEREKSRRARNWTEADRLRDEIETLGFLIEDTPEGPKLKPK